MALKCFGLAVIWSLGMGIIFYHFSSTKKSSYLERLLSSPLTYYQIALDIIGGVILPIICLRLDFIVFGDFGFGDLGILIELEIFFYTVIIISMIGLILWFLLRRFTSLSGFFAGILAVGTLISAALGVTIFPLTLIGMLWIIGFLGLSPFITSFVFFRNGYRAINQMPQRSWLTIACGIVFALGIPILLQWQISNTITTSTQQLLYAENETIALQSGETLDYFFEYLPHFTHWQAWQVWQNRPIFTKDIVEGKFSINRLKHVGRCVYCWEDIARAYLNERNLNKKAHIAKIYNEATGEDISNSRVLDRIYD